MPSFQGIVKDNEVGALIAYIKSLNPDFKGADPSVETGAASSEAPKPGEGAPVERSQELLPKDDAEATPAPAETTPPAETPAAETPAPETAELAAEPATEETAEPAAP